MVPATVKSYGSATLFLQDMPGFFSRYVILNTNNLPDGELELFRFRHKTNLAEFLVANAFFLAFRYSCRAHS
jgi:hypothetical protein